MSRVFLAPDILNEMGRISMYNKNVAIILSISSHILIIPDIIDSHRKRRKAARVVKARHARHSRWRWISSAILRLRRTRTHLRSNPSTQINGNACDDDATVRHRRLPESGLQLMSETTVWKHRALMRAYPKGSPVTWSRIRVLGCAACSWYSILPSTVLRSKMHTPSLRSIVLPVEQNERIESDIAEHARSYMKLKSCPKRGTCRSFGRTIICNGLWIWLDPAMIWRALVWQGKTSSFPQMTGMTVHLGGTGAFGDGAM